MDSLFERSAIVFSRSMRETPRTNVRATLLLRARCHAKKDFRRYRIHIPPNNRGCKVSVQPNLRIVGVAGRSRVLIWRANVGVADRHATRTVKNSHKPSKRAGKTKTERDRAIEEDCVYAPRKRGKLERCSRAFGGP